MITTQVELDYANAAQQRVCADTRVLKKKATFTLNAGANTISLPEEVLRIEALSVGGVLVEPIGRVDYMRLASGAQTVGSGTQLFFCVIGRTLYFYPANTAAQRTLDTIYSYRAAPMDSNTQFELVGSAERLIERVASAYVLLDDGQPELGQQELSAYMADAVKLRHRQRRGTGTGNRMRIAGYRTRS